MDCGCVTEIRQADEPCAFVGHETNWPEVLISVWTFHVRNDCVIKSSRDVWPLWATHQCTMMILKRKEKHHVLQANCLSLELMLCQIPFMIGVIEVLSFLGAVKMHRSLS